MNRLVFSWKCWIFHENCFCWMSVKKRNLKVNFKWKIMHESSSGWWLKECAVLRSIYFLLKDLRRPVWSRSKLYIPALTLPFSSVFFDSFSITLLYSRRRGSWLWHSPGNTNTAIICVMGVSLNLTTPIKFSLTLINSDVHCILCKVYNRVHSSNITCQPWKLKLF